MIFLFKINFLMFFLNCFDVLISKIKKNIILMYFQVKYILKINCYYNTKTLSGPEEAKSF